MLSARAIEGDGKAQESNDGDIAFEVEKCAESCAKAQFAESGET